jgi:glutathione S-transferase
MSLEFFGHPFSSYTQKVLIPLWANETPFDYRVIGPDDPENIERLKQHSPYGMFPLLIDDGRSVFESTTIIEYLDAHHPGPIRWIPDGEAGLRVRFLDRFFDLYVMGNMQKSGLDILRPEGCGDPYGANKARDDLHIAYDWLEANLGDGPWAVGKQFSMADCAAAPSLFYADWIEEIGPARPKLSAYRARLLAHPIVARAVDEGRPYRPFFPMGAPDRD